MRTKQCQPFLKRKKGFSLKKQKKGKYIQYLPFGDEWTGITNPLPFGLFNRFLRLYKRFQREADKISLIMLAHRTFLRNFLSIIYITAV